MHNIIQYVLVQYTMAIPIAKFEVYYSYSIIYVFSSSLLLLLAVAFYFSSPLVKKTGWQLYAGAALLIWIINSSLWYFIFVFLFLKNILTLQLQNIRTESHAHIQSVHTPWIVHKNEYTRVRIQSEMKTDNSKWYLKIRECVYYTHILCWIHRNVKTQNIGHIHSFVNL